MTGMLDKRIMKLHYAKSCMLIIRLCYHMPVVTQSGLKKKLKCIFHFILEEINYGGSGLGPGCGNTLQYM